MDHHHHFPAFIIFHHTIWCHCTLLTAKDKLLTTVGDTCRWRIPGTHAVQYPVTQISTRKSYEEKKQVLYMCVLHVRECQRVTCTLCKKHKCNEFKTLAKKNSFFKFLSVACRRRLERIPHTTAHILRSHTKNFKSWERTMTGLSNTQTSTALLPDLNIQIPTLNVFMLCADQQCCWVR